MQQRAQLIRFLSLHSQQLWERNHKKFISHLRVSRVQILLSMTQLSYLINFSDQMSHQKKKGQGVCRQLLQPSKSFRP